MKPRTEEFLNFLIWTAETLLRPTWRNLTESFEGWAYRTGLMRQVAALEKRRFLERDPAHPGDRVYRLTEEGRLHALGGRDPEAQWSRAWDGRWRIVLFDLPVEQNSDRERLRRYLRARAFGCLQNSVWVTPDAVALDQDALAGGKINVESLLMLEARPCAGESDAEIVAGAWDFARINQAYARHAQVLEQRPGGRPADEAAANALRRWGMAEREAWLAAVGSDPLLPGPLLPPDYAGQAAWRRRIEVLREAGRQVRSFRG